MSKGKYSMVALCTFMHKCRWQRRRLSRSGKKYNTCLIARIAKNFTCNQLRFIDRNATELRKRGDGNG